MVYMGKVKVMTSKADLLSCPASTCKNTPRDSDYKGLCPSELRRVSVLEGYRDYMLNCGEIVVEDELGVCPRQVELRES